MDRLKTFRLPDFLFDYGPPAYDPACFHGRPGLWYVLEPTRVLEVAGTYDDAGPEATMIVLAVPIAAAIACVSPYTCGGDMDAAAQYEFAGIDLDRRELYVVPKGRRIPLHGVRVRREGRAFTVRATAGERKFLAVSGHVRAVAAQFRAAAHLLREEQGSQPSPRHPQPCRDQEKRVEP